MSPQGWLALGLGFGFLVATFAQMALAVHLGRYRVDMEGKQVGGLDSSYPGIVSQLSRANYTPEAYRQLPILQVIVGFRIAFAVAFIWALSRVI